MRAAHRRQRESNTLASPDAVNIICQLLRERMSDTIPASEKQFVRFLFAVRHVERLTATNTKRGRPSHWPREKLMEAASQLRGILERETSGRVSVNSFIGRYIPILNYPSDVKIALSRGEINLHQGVHSPASRLSGWRLPRRKPRPCDKRYCARLAALLTRPCERAPRRSRGHLY